jgi:hypothetical protein
MKHGESNMYKNVTHVRSQGERQSNGEVLAVVNKILNQKPERYKFSPSYPGYYNDSFFTHFWFSKVELDQGDKWKDASSNVPRKV